MAPSASRLDVLRALDPWFNRLTGLCALLVFVALVALGVMLFHGGWLAFKTFGWHFAVSQAWDPVAGDFGALIPIIGTLASSAVALLIAVPVSFGIAIFITELAPVWLRRPVGSAIELLAAIPSIIYGMWGLFVFCPLLARLEPWIDRNLGAIPGAGILFQGPPMGVGLLSAGLILGIMVIPFIATIMRDVFLTTPAIIKESAYALGATTWEVVWHVVVPHTRSAVIGGIFLGLARALGETMAVTFVIGNAHQLSASLLAPANSISATIANEFAEADTDLYRASLLALGFILCVISMIVLIAGKALLARQGVRTGTV